ncbi:MAG: hypothetical protein U1F59_01535 [Candidatus Competibacteraceae bacterium]
MDLGIPTEETLAAMRQAQPPIYYVVGTPKGRLSQLEQAFVSKPWEQAHREADARVEAPAAPPPTTPPPERKPRKASPAPPPAPSAPAFPRPQL